MTVIHQYFALSDQGLASKTWRRMVRIDTVGADTSVVIKAMSQLALDGLVYAEGDSWFDKFTPIPTEGTNLLEEIRTPFVAGVVDVAHIGDEARDMVRGWQASRTREMFRLFSFKAILLSAGGNDLKNLFSDLFENKGLLKAGQSSRLSESDLAGLATPASYTEFFEDVITNIQRFVDMRDEAQGPGDAEGADLPARLRLSPASARGCDDFRGHTDWSWPVALSGAAGGGLDGRGNEVGRRRHRGRTEPPTAVWPSPMRRMSTSSTSAGC